MNKDEIINILDQHTKNIDRSGNFIMNLIKNIKRTLSDIMEDIRLKRYGSFIDFLSLFVKSDRALYFGIFLVFICVILYVLSFLFYSKKNIDSCESKPISVESDSSQIDKILKKIENLDSKIKINNLAMEVLSHKVGTNVKTQ